MSEVDQPDSFNVSSTRFRTSTFPGTVSGHVDTAGNVQAPGSPVAEASRANALGALSTAKPIETDLTKLPDMPPAPSLGDETKQLGEAAAGGAAQFAGSTFGSGAGRAIATGSNFSDAAQAGVDSVADKVADIGSDLRGFVGEGNSTAGITGPGLKPAFDVGTSSLGSGAAGSGAGSLGAGAEQATFEEATGAAPALGAAEEGGQAAGSAAAAGSESLGNFGSYAGAGVGAGLVSFGIGLLTGESVGRAAKQGLGAGAGTAIGLAISGGNPIGGFIGGAIGGIIGGGGCFVAGTLVMMADGTWKAVELLIAGDETMLGGQVVGGGWVVNMDLYFYRGTRVDGGHAVFHEGKWIRVAEVGTKLEMDEPVMVYPVVTQHHLMVLDGFVAADFAEIDMGSRGRISDEDILAVLNGEAASSRNALIRQSLDDLFISNGKATL